MVARITSIPKKPTSEVDKYEHWQRDPVTTVTVSVPFKSIPGSMDFFLLDEFGQIKNPIYLVKCTFLDFPNAKIDFVEPTRFLAIFWR